MGRQILKWIMPYIMLLSRWRALRIGILFSNIFVCGAMLGLVGVSPNLIASADLVAVSGVVIDETTSAPVSGVQVSLYEITEAWKFWTLPGRELVDSVVSNSVGEFSLSGEATGGYFVELIDDSGCWMAAIEIFSEKVNGRVVENVRLLTVPGRCKSRR